MARLDDGHSTTVSFGTSTVTKLYEKEVTPPGMEGGGENDTTTMHNTVYRTKSPKKLKSLTDMSMVCAYDPAAYSELVAAININQLITVTFPDGDTLAFWGWLDVFTPNAIVEGEQPTANVTIICSNQNASGVETAPSYSA